MQFQSTLQRNVTFSGIGLHSGNEVNISLYPAKPDTGIVFRRVDLPGKPEVAAKAANVTNAMRATTLEAGEAKVFTVEHLLSAFAALGIDNCLVEIDSLEPPVGDGSSLPFAELVLAAGIISQNAERKIIEPAGSLIIREQDKFITILPYDGLRITFTSINPHPLIGIQFGDYEITPETYIKEIAPARTVGFMHEVEMLKSQGLALGGSLDNVVVYDDDSLLTPLRFPDELVRHKILDIIGDLSLAGFVKGHIIAVKSSHALNTQLAQKIVKSV